MKLLPNHSSLIIHFFLPITCIALIFILFFNHEILFVFRIHWLLLAFAFFIVCTPLGSYKAKVEHRLPWWLCLLSIIALHIMAYYLFYAVTVISNHSLPVLTPAQPIDYANSYRQFLQWGFYPWAFYAVVATALSYLSYTHQQPGLTSILLRPLFHNAIEDDIGVYSDTLMRLLLIFSVAYLISLCILFMITEISYLKSLPIHFGISLISLIIFTLLLSFNKQPIWRYYLRFNAFIKLPIIVSIMVFSIIITLVAIVLNIIIAYCTTYLPSLTTPLIIITHTQWLNYWHIFITIWWLYWLPLVSGLIAVIFRGYSLRCLLLTVLLPLFMYEFILTKFSFLSTLLSANKLELLVPLLALFIIFIVLGLLLYQPQLTYIMRATLPKSCTIKTRKASLFLENTLQASLLLTFIYLIAGIPGISVISFIMLFPVGIIMLMACLAFLKAFVFKRS